MKSAVTALVLAALFGGSGCSRTPKKAIYDSVSGPPSLFVTSSAFARGTMIPDKFSSYTDNYSPPLNWTRPPPGTKSVAVFVQDPDAAGDAPFTHWLIIEIPESVRTLPQGVDNTDDPTDVPGAIQGTNQAGSIGYYGPHPPVGELHHYHFQVFALNEKLPLLPGFSAKQFTDVIQGNVLAKGELIGVYQKQ